MRLAIDCVKLLKGAGKSIGIYNVAMGIVRHLGEQIDTKQNDLRDEIIVLGNKYNRTDFDVPGVLFVEVSDIDPTNKVQVVIWELFRVSKVCKKLKIDRVFFPRGFNALTHPIEDVVLIHDMIPFYYAEHFPGALNRIENTYIRYRLKSSARSAKKVITISEASKRDIIKYCGIDESKIVVINNACEELERVNDESGIGDSYICAMTSKLPHKNAKGLLKAYDEYVKMEREPLELVIIGLTDVQEFNLSNRAMARIKCYGFVKDNNDLYTIIGRSKLFVFLSLYEGFGLPPVEAMMLGVPVICANNSSLPEVTGDAAILVDPQKSKEIALQIRRVLNDAFLQEEMKKRGRNNIKKFSWEKTGEKYWRELLN